MNRRTNEINWHQQFHQQISDSQSVVRKSLLTSLAPHFLCQKAEMCRCLTSNISGGDPQSAGFFWLDQFDRHVFSNNQMVFFRKFVFNMASIFGVSIAMGVPPSSLDGSCQIPSFEMDDAWEFPHDY